MSPRSSSSSALHVSGPLHSPSHHTHSRRAEPDLREQIARHLVSTQGPGSDSAVAGRPPGEGQHPEPLPAGAAGQRNPRASLDSPRGSSSRRRSLDSPAGSSKGSRSSSTGSNGRKIAELSRTQLKAVRKLFPIMQPSLKPAAALQVGGEDGLGLEGLDNGSNSKQQQWQRRDHPIMPDEQQPGHQLLQSRVLHTQSRTGTPAV